MAAQQRDRQFKVLKFLGKGSYGSVFLVQRLADAQTYALKEMDVRSMSQAEREDSINEIRLLASVSHPNVISYNEAFLDGNRLCIIMEYAADGDLAKVIKKHQMMKRPLPEDLIWRYFIQVVRGLQALHAMKILHRDIKPGNIMVFEGGVVKIGDLGIAKLLTKTAAAKTQIGTPHYMGPEIWKNRPYSYTSDTWAIGCLLYELTTLNVPFEARSMSELRYKVLRGTYPPVPNTFSRDLQQMIRECLDPNPDKRPSMDALLGCQAVASRLKLVPAESRHPPATAGSALVDTIKVPRGNIAAIKNKLPPAQYATDMLNMGNGAPRANGHVPNVAQIPHGSPHGGMNGHMATIDEGDEDSTPPSRPNGQLPNRAPMPPMPPMPKPNYPPPPVNYVPPQPALPPPAPSAGAAKLPALGAGGMGGYSVAHSDAGGGYANAARLGGGGGNGNNVVRPPPLVPPPSQGGQSAWSYNQGMGNVGGGVSESHANYGAFYHRPGNGYTPSNGPSRAISQQPSQNPSQQQQQQRQGQGQGQWQAGNKWPPGNYQSPYAYGGQQQQQQQQQQRPYAVAQGNGGALPAIAQRAPPSQASKPPPWNYGGQRRNARGMPQARQYGQYGAGYENGGGADVQRYPPPQWAPRPARW